MEKLISVIIPVYNVEKYLDKCVNSIINQTYKNLEIILVNDGSTDNSLNICMNYKKKDRRIKVLNKVNGGQSSARNQGLDIASGDYITFVDSDDFIELNLYKNLLDLMNENNADIAMTQVRVVNEDEETILNTSLSEPEISSSKIFIQSLLEYKGSSSVCDKIFCRSIYKNIRFDENIKNEDLMLLIDIFLEKDYKIYIDNKIGYNYLKRDGSTTNSGFSQAIIDMVYNTKTIEAKVLEKHPDMSSIFKGFRLMQIRTFLLLVPIKNIENKEKNFEYTMKLLKKEKSYIYKSYIDNTSKIYLYMCLLSPKFSRLLLNFLLKNIFKGRLNI